MGKRGRKEPIVRVFLSYSNKDKGIAGNLKRCLEYYGVSAFLAHEDIEGGEEWAREILSALDSSQVLIVILTIGAKMSSYVSQEIGYAIARDTVILPFKVGINPFGFAARIQALKPILTYNIQTQEKVIDFESSAEKIARKISQIDPLSASFRKGLVTSFATSGSYKETQCKLKFLRYYDDLTDEEKVTILKAGLDNDQIYREDMMRNFLYKVITTEPNLLNKTDTKLLLTNISAR
jgi:hypothetical protein